jgi:hypothetical protein
MTGHTGRMDGVRAFEFPDDEAGHPVSFWTALDAVRSALDDEGLALADRSSRMKLATAVRQPDCLILIVPERAIVGRDWPRR